MKMPQRIDMTYRKIVQIEEKISEEMNDKYSQIMRALKIDEERIMVCEGRNRELDEIHR